MGKASPEETPDHHKLALQATWTGSNGTVELPMQISLHTTPDHVADLSVVRLLQKFREATMRIYDAIWAEQRVLFVGYQCPTGEICNCVLAACALVAPHLRGIVQRCFPYSSLLGMDEFLAVPGFIVGVTNPVFKTAIAQIYVRGAPYGGSDKSNNGCRYDEYCYDVCAFHGDDAHDRDKSYDGYGCHYERDYYETVITTIIVIICVIN